MSRWAFRLSSYAPRAEFNSRAIVDIARTGIDTDLSLAVLASPVAKQAARCPCRYGRPTSAHSLHGITSTNATGGRGGGNRYKSPHHWAGVFKESRAMRRTQQSFFVVTVLFVALLSSSSEALDARASTTFAAACRSDGRARTDWRDVVAPQPAVYHFAGVWFPDSFSRCRDFSSRDQLGVAAAARSGASGSHTAQILAGHQ